MVIQKLKIPKLTLMTPFLLLNIVDAIAVRFVNFSERKKINALYIISYEDVFELDFEKNHFS